MFVELGMAEPLERNSSLCAVLDELITVFWEKIFVNSLEISKKTYGKFTGELLKKKMRCIPKNIPENIEETLKQRKNAGGINSGNMEGNLCWQILRRTKNLFKDG